eukprot:gene6804-7572_t
MAARHILVCILFFWLENRGTATEYFSVFEELDAGTWVGNITQRANFKYYFSETNEYFQINPDLASIYTKSKINRESLVKDEFQLVVLSSAPIYATEVTIKVIDINDHAPKFKHSLVNLSISESLSINTLIPIDSASDLDSGTNAAINYSIVNSGENNNNKFSLELIFNLLHLKVLSSLDRETQDSYTLNISATDGGKPAKYGFMVLRISLLDTNDNHPMFNPSAFRSDIYENAIMGTVVHQANATDSDIGKNGLISYSIDMYNKDYAVDLFFINSSSGLITLNGKLDYETKKQYTIHIIAKDHGNPALVGRATVTVDVKNINDNYPLISNWKPFFDVEENKLCSYCLFFTISDKDSSVLTFQIISGNEEGNFQLEKFGENNYFFKVVTKLDREKTSKYVLRFQASDDGNPQLTSSYTLVVNVTDKNDNKPVFKQSVYSGNITEGCPLGTYVADPIAVDVDLGLNSKITYSILSGNERNWFKISSFSGLITTNSADIDYDALTDPFMLLHILAKDQGTPSLNSTAILNITIQDVNDNTPMFNKSVYSINVNESVIANSLLLQVQAYDKDHGVNGKIAYKFSFESERIQRYFQIKNDNGELRLKRSLDYRKDKLFEFFVTAEDGGIPSKYSRAKIIVNVLDVDNFAPMFYPTTFYVNLLTAKSKGLVTTITAIDQDSGLLSKIIYSIDSGDCCNYFNIGEHDGHINSTSTIAAGTSHQLIIKARNTANTQFAYATVYIMTLASFDLNPIFTRDEYVFTVTENAVGRLVGQVKLLLKNDASRVVFTIVSGDDWQHFYINSKGEIITRLPIDREQFSRFSLGIAAHTNTSIPLTSHTRVTVLIDDVNDNSPELTDQHIDDYTINENSAVGSHVLTVKTKDADSGLNGALKYSVIETTSQGAFAIDKYSGKVFLVKSLLNGALENYVINIEISDSGLPPRTLKTKIRISVIDFNNNYPVFNAASYSIKISSNMTVNTKFLQLKADDIDLGRNGRVLYRIRSGNFAYDDGIASKSSTVKVEIFVDRIITMGIYKKSSYEINVKEHLSAGTVVANLFDYVDGDKVSLRFSLPLNSKYFLLGSKDGLLTSRLDIDREKVIQDTGSDVIIYRVQVERKTSTAIKTDMCIFSVKVIDENDNGPVFKKSTYVATVSEAALSGSFLLRVLTSDPDSAENSLVTYGLQASTHVPFKIDKTSGIISVDTTHTSLDREVISTYNFTVLAKDTKNASLNSTCKVFIGITDVNDEKPEFITKQNAVTVDESISIGSTIFTFKAIDKDESFNAFVEYSLIDSSNSETFAINAYTGELYLLKNLDYETKNSHMLTIIAKDLGSPSLQTSKSFNVHVSDSNDNNPIFQLEPVVIYVVENVPLATVIGHCSASDADSGNNKVIRYSIISQKPVKDAFLVDSTTCAISNKIHLDREQNKGFEIVIKAEDQSIFISQRLSDTKTVKIVILDLNDNSPSFVPPLGKGFIGQPTTGNQVITVNALDPDQGVNGTVKYSIEQGYDSAYFQIDQNSGVTTVKASLSSSRKVYTIMVKATDSNIHGRSSTALITLFREGIAANAPTCNSAVQATVKEGVIGRKLYRAQATSPESSSELKYFIKGGNTDHAFVIDPLTGWVSNYRVLDFEMGPRVYRLTIAAVELSGITARTVDCSVELTIGDINDNYPVFNSSFISITIMENIAVGSLVYKIDATDKDSGRNGSVSYSIFAGNVMSTFRIDSNTGSLYSTKELNRENIAEYNLTVTATDNGDSPLQSRATLIIKVGDYNDNKPMFNQSYYSFEISESKPLDSFVGQVLASDADVGRNGEVIYKVLNGENDTFAVNQMTGEIRLSRRLDYEKMPNYILELIAFDYGQPSLSSRVLVFINVIDVNDNCPVFEKESYSARIPENASPGLLAAKVTAKDLDSGSYGIVQYSFSSGNFDRGFSISSSGEVRTLRSLDREMRNMYTLRIAAKDQGNSIDISCFAYAFLTVFVDDINDNSPVFHLPLNVYVYEDKAVGSIVHTLNATDKDFGLNASLTYKMVKPNLFEDTFHVDVNGNILLQSRLDYERKTSYNFQVIATDKGSPPREALSNITVFVRDSNDNSPVISQHKASISLLENTTIGTEIMQFVAIDQDAGENGRISFSIYSGNKNGSFSIDPEAGVLFINKELDYEVQHTYLLEIETKDHGIPQRRGLTSFTVFVTDINDGAPTFRLSSYNVSIVENSTPRVLIQLAASDTDSGLNKIVAYSIKKSALSGIFSIDSQSGVISTMKAIDREVSSVIKLVIVAKDRGSPSLQGGTTLFVNILDENDNFPQIYPQSSNKLIKENLPSNYEVQRLHISDDDYGANSTLTFELVNNFGRFQMKELGHYLIISTTTYLDREISSSYNLTVVVRDSGTPSLASRAYVGITVLDDNDHPPVFTRKRFDVKVRAGAPAQSFVTKLQVTDQDIGENAKFLFAIVSGNTSYFDIEQQTGIVTTKFVIPQSAVFEIVVQVSDPVKTNFKDVATVSITTASGYPIFSHGNQYTSVPENFPVNGQIMNINATSKEIGPAGKINFFIYSGNVDNVFGIHQDTGIITVKNPLDYEKRTIYSLWIEARDSRNPPLSSYVKLVITVINVKDSAPKITAPTKAVLFVEQQGANALVTTIKAIDLDDPLSTARLRYRLGNSSLSLPFTINELSGDVRSTAVLDREQRSTYNLTITVYPFDQPWRTSSIIVDIELQDTNDNPPVVHSPQTVSISEDASIGTALLTINATDKDIGENKVISFHLISSAFTIDAQTGVITLKRQLDREVQSSYLLSISVKDITFETIHELTVYVTDVNDSPPYFTPEKLFINVSENTGIGQSFGRVKAEDKDIGFHALSFYYIKPRSGHGIFAINSNDGSLSLKKAVKFVKSSPGKASSNEYNLTVYARNLYRPFYIANTSLTIRVQDYNDHAPIFTKLLYNVHVLSTASVGHTVSTLSAVDNYDVGLNALVNYVVTGGNGSTLFGIDAAQVKVTAPLLAFANKVLQLVVEARDSGTPIMKSKVQATVIVSVVGANRFSPVFTASSYQVTIAESHRLYLGIINVKATDQDSGLNGRVSYRIISGDTDGVFHINAVNGTVHAVKHLDYESVKSYVLTVEARDHAPINTGFINATVTIKLTDVNDNSPVFTSNIYEASVAENEPVRTFVVKVSATDKDLVASDTILYSFDDTSTSSYFSINTGTGLIETKSALDYEQTSSFILKVKATDNGSPSLSSSAIVKVKVIGRNEFAPKFSQSIYNFTITKSALMSHIVGKVKASDQDKGIDGIMLYLPRISSSSLPFSLDRSTGDIRVANKLAVRRFTFKIFVKNIEVRSLKPGNFDEALIYIEVVEGNEAPSFSKLVYHGNVREDANAGSSVLMVSAVDKDAKQGGTIFYEITSQTPSADFSINANTGVINVASLLNRETIPNYNLTIKATDSGINPAFNTTQVRIQILDINDMPPEIATCTGSVYENASANTIAAKLFVTDDDLDPNRGPFNFTLVGNTEFGISSSGELFVKSSLDRERRAVYNISLAVTDSGTPPLTSRGFCIITVLDVSDTLPRPRSVRIIVNSLKEYLPGGLLGNVSPIDPDPTDAYTCMLNQSTSLFTFELSSCNLHAAAHRNVGFLSLNYLAFTKDIKVTSNNAVIDFVSVRNVTVDNIFIFRLNGIEDSLSVFTNRSLDLLSNFLVGVSPARYRVRIIGYDKRNKNSLDMLLVMQNTSSSFASSFDQLEQIVKDNIQNIAQITKSTSSEVPHNACSPVNPCLNNAHCKKVLKLDGSRVIHSSVTVIFHSIGFKSTFSCRCKPGYHGSRCEYAISNCLPNPCLNNGICKHSSSNRTCVCSEKFTGQYCETDVNECNKSPCRNNGVCVNLVGDYRCNCPVMYTGKDCENSFDPCKPNPCLSDGVCSLVGNSFACSCKYGYKGRVCEIHPMTFAPLSYLATAYNPNRALNVTFDFATYQTNSLLLYGYHKTLSRTNSPFVALEIINQYLRISFSFGTTLVRKTIGSVKASDGNWHKATAYLSGVKLTLSLDKVENYLVLNEAAKTPDLGGTPLYIGGVESIKPILNRPQQAHTEDFVGCMRNFLVYNLVVDDTTSMKAVGISKGCTKSPGCTTNPCKNGKCINDWGDSLCQCNFGFSGSTCSEAAKPITFGGSSFVMLQLKESYRRKLQLAEILSARRRRRNAVQKLPASSSFSIRIRTRSSNGIIMYAKDVEGNYTLLYIKDGEVNYRFDIVGKGSGSLSIGKPLVNDGMWHNVSLTVDPNLVTLGVDGVQSTHNSLSVTPHQFYSRYTDILSIAGYEKPIDVSGFQMPTFQGCLDNISLNGDSLSIQKSDKFNITQVGSVSSSCPGRDVCASSPCKHPDLSYCIDTWENYSCVHPGKCATAPCKNNGVCIPIATTSYKCNCRGNFTGTNCETPLICLTSPCKSNEICIADVVTTFRCMLVSKPNTGLGTVGIVLIVVFSILVVLLVCVFIFCAKRRKKKKLARHFSGDFTDSTNAVELKEKTDYDNQGYESEQSLDGRKAETFHYAADASEYDNEGYMHSYGSDLISKRNSEFLSKSQPLSNQPYPHREARHQTGSNHSLPLGLIVRDRHASHSDSRLNRDVHLEMQRNERILQDLRGFPTESSQRDQTSLDHSLKKFSSLPKIQQQLQGTATPPFESGFESTGSDMDSERGQGSLPEFGIENASSQLELYDLEVASIGFSEMSWQNDNKSLRDYRRENIERFHHYPPHHDLYDHGSNLSERNTRISDLDRLSDVIEQDSSSESDGSFTGSEYEYGDERISSNKLKRKHLMFSKLSPDICDSDIESSFRPHIHSICSSMTSLTDIGSIAQGHTSRASTTFIPPINWDELLNWGMKYENLADVYRALASFNDTPLTVSSTYAGHGNEAVKRSMRLQAEPDRGASVHGSAQDLHRRSPVALAQTREEEYV